MQSHGPKRVYSPHSLEFWFEKLAEDWAPHFSEADLEEGRRLYRDGEVRELELTAKDAIIHRKVEKKDEYAVIEWEDGKLNVRSSSTNEHVAYALAVAGLHEIEELVCDEISPLPDSKPSRDFTTNGGTGHSASAPTSPLSSTVKPAGLAARRLGAAGGNATPAAGGASTPSRRLLLAFETKTDGLSFQAFWQQGPKTRVPALGQAAQASGNGHFSSGERAKLIGLAAYARKAHFNYNQTTGLYLLESLVEIPKFLQTVLPAWRKLFAIELDANAANLMKGPLALEVEAAARRSENGGIDLRWIFRSGERLLSDDETALLLKRNQSPVLLPSLGIVTMPAERLETLKAWQRNVGDTHANGELSPYLLFSLYSDARVKLTLSPELEAWRKSVVTPTEVAVKLPELLRPYQRRGVEWMHHLADVGCHGLLADEMGLGKTLQVITLLAHRPLKKLPSLIVCPASVVPVWREEIARFYPELKVDTLKSGNDFAARKDGCIWLASYTQLRKHRALLDEREFGYAVLDEGQFIKNPDAKITQTCFAVRAKHRIVLSGTPLENRQLDLWSIFRFLLPGLLGSRSSFEGALTAERAATLERLRAQLAPFILRRTKKEVATELPPKVEMDLLCPLTDVQRAEYARICSEGLQRLGDDVGTAMREKSFGFLALLTRLRQICCDPDMLPWLKAPHTDSGKITLLLEKLAEIISSGHKVVIFSQFVMLIDRVRTALAERYPELARFELTGMTTDRLKPVQGFQNASGAAVMLVSLKAAGTGITLHAADYVFLLDPWWNPAVEAQAVDRVHRIGQKSTVFVYRMITAGTVEERIQALKASKKDLFDKLVGGLGGDFDLSQHFHSLQGLIQLTTAQVADESEPEHLGGA